MENYNSTNVLFLGTFKNMQLDERRMRRKVVSLVSFDERFTSTIGEIELQVFAEGINFHITFLVINSSSTYNVILGRPYV